MLKKVNIVINFKFPGLPSGGKSLAPRFPGGGWLGYPERGGRGQPGLDLAVTSRKKVHFKALGPRLVQGRGPPAVARGRRRGEGVPSDMGENDYRALVTNQCSFF
jgi:hypothetical protein